jgi:hypothetical protein
MCLGFRSLEYGGLGLPSVRSGLVLLLCAEPFLNRREGSGYVLPS